MSAVNFSTNFTGGVAPSDYTPTTISGMGSAIGKVAEQVIRQFSAKNPLEVFEKKPVNNGTTIEQMFVELIESQAYDPDGANALTRKNPDLIVKYFDDWTPAKFHTSVDTSLIRKVLIGEKSASDVATKIVSVLSESDTHEKYLAIKQLLALGKQVADGGQNTGGTASGVGATLVRYATIPYDSVNSTIDYKGILVALKDAVSGMQFVNSSFNTASVVKKTDKEDIYILMPYTLKNRIDVGELAGVFNLDKDRIEGKIIEIDVDEASHYNYIYVVDRNAILSYTRLYEMLDQLNADGRFWNYFLHVERMFGISPLFDACYIKVGTSATE